MAVFLVTWELNREKPNYAQARATFLATLEQFEYTKDQGLDSVAFVASTSTADGVSDTLRKRLDDNDRLVVTKLVSGSHQGWLSKTTWDWINARL
jgi:hypothetical protein